MVFMYCAYFMQNGTLRQGSDSGQIDTGVQFGLELACWEGVV